MAPRTPSSQTILHQLLAVRERFKSQANKVWQDTRGLLVGKTHHFSETQSEFQPGVQDLQTEMIESKGLQTTISKELKWSTNHLANAIDIDYQIDVGKVSANADIEIGDNVMARDIPATTLLSLETYLQKVLDLLQIVPTLDPAKGFSPAPERGPGIYKARDVRKVKTRKQSEVITLSPATDKHPANVQLVNIDFPIGHIVEQEWSSLITPAKKSELLERAETMLRAVKDARARANALQLDIQPLKIGDKLISYILEPLNTF